MSANSTSKLHPTNSEQEAANAGSKPESNGTAALTAKVEEDDEFEDFPVEDWGDEDTDMGASAGKATGTGANPGSAAAAPAASGGHLWEESWDDDNGNESFAAMLKEELKKVDGGKR